MRKDPLLPLKLLVYGMGILLVCGFVWLAFKLAFKASELGNRVCDTVEITESAPTDARLSDLRYADSEWHLHYALPTGKHLLRRYDRCGKKLQELQLTTPTKN